MSFLWDTSGIRQLRYPMQKQRCPLMEDDPDPRGRKLVMTGKFTSKLRLVCFNYAGFVSFPI
jgi:hypothetical protein